LAHVAGVARDDGVDLEAVAVASLRDVKGVQGLVAHALIVEDLSNATV